MLPTIVPAVLRPVTALHGRPGDEPRSTIVRPSEAKAWRSEEHTSELQSQSNLVCRLLLEKKKKTLPPFPILPSPRSCSSSTCCAAHLLLAHTAVRDSLLSRASRSLLWARGA